MATTSLLAIESWAEAVEYYFTLPYYPNEVEGIPDQSFAEIEEGDNNAWRYIPFFVDLRDNSNQRILYGNGSANWANDNVSGFTFEELQDALVFETRIGGVANHLEKFTTNSTRHHLDDLMDFYDELQERN